MRIEREGTWASALGHDGPEWLRFNKAELAALKRAADIMNKADEKLLEEREWWQDDDCRTDFALCGYTLEDVVADGGVRLGM